MWPFRKPAPAETKSLANPDDWLRELFGATPSAAGVSVTPASAMRCTAVRRAVAAISEPIGSLPLHVYRRDGEARERDVGHPVARLLRDPNPWTSASEFREQLQRDCLLHGNGLALITRVNGEPRELLRLDPASVQIEADDFGGPVYRQVSGEQRRTLPREDVFHIRAASLDGVRGESPVRQCREAIATALVLEKHVAKLFGTGAKPGGVIEVPLDTPEDAYRSMLAAWRQSNEGSENSGRTALLVNGATFRPITMTSTDAQLLELRKYAVDEIARAFSVPPHLLYEMGRATWGNAAELGSVFVTFSLMRWIKAWQNEIRLKLFKPEERDDFFAEFLLEDLLKADLSARATAYSQLRAAGIMSINECRARENLPPIGPEGDRHDNPNITTAAPAAPKESE